MELIKQTRMLELISGSLLKQTLIGQPAIGEENGAATKQPHNIDNKHMTGYR